jgi:hypothetical protein
MRWSNFIYVFHQEGMRSAIKIATWGWLSVPWLSMRIKIANGLISILRVKEEFDI